MGQASIDNKSMYKAHLSGASLNHRAWEISPLCMCVCVCVSIYIYHGKECHSFTNKLSINKQNSNVYNLSTKFSSYALYLHVNAY
jgi:hypothetical protein